MAGISGILAALCAEEAQPQEPQHSDPQGRRGRLRPHAARRFGGGAGEFEGRGFGVPLVLVRSARRGEDKARGQPARPPQGSPMQQTALSQILQVNSMLTMGREVAAPDIAERADDFEYHCRKAEAPVEG